VVLGFTTDYNPLFSFSEKFYENKKSKKFFKFQIFIIFIKTKCFPKIIIETCLGENKLIQKI
jgi:hypothetical protein